METFTLSRKELHRPGLLKALCGGRLTNAQVAAALRITVRQVRRLKRRFEAGGPGALVHGNRDRPSPRRLPAAVRDAVVRLMTTVYVGFNDTHLTEKLREHHALGISRETVRRYREQLGHPPKRARRAPRVRRRRVPSAARGALIQLDGRPFPWLQDRGPAPRPRRPTWPSSSPTSISASGNRPPTARRCGAGRRAISPSASAAATAAWSPATTPCASGLAWCSSVARAPTPG